MNTITRALAWAGALALFVTTVAARADDSDATAAEAAASAVADARKESQIWTTFALSPYLRADDLRVRVVDGEATLTGVVQEDVTKELAEQIARGVAGITGVENRILVRSGHEPVADPDQHRYGSAVADASIAAAVRAKMTWSRRVGNGPSEITVAQGKVTLRGFVATARDHAFLTKLAFDTPGVHSVDNRMAILQGTDAPVAPAATVAEVLADSWITTKVKSTFMYSSNVDGADITVSTLAGVVTLSGTVASGTERALAVELARNVRGVKRVDSSALTLQPDEDVIGAPSGS